MSLHALITREVSGDEFSGFFIADTELLGESIGRLPVHNSKIDRLRAVPLSRCDQAERNTKDFGRGTAMNILSCHESLGQPGVTGEMRDDPEFDLGIIGRNEPPARFGNEGPADLTA